MKPTEAAELVKLLRAAYPRTTIGDDTTSLWLEELGKLDQRIGAAAVKSLVAVTKTWPSIAHLLEQVAIAHEQAARERRAEEHRQAELEYESIPKVELSEIPAVAGMRERFAKLQAKYEELQPLDPGTNGLCDDGCGRTGHRYKLGDFQVCAECAARRLQARQQVNGEAA